MSALAAKWAPAALAFATFLALPTAAAAQSSASAYTTGHRYDAMGRETGTILPDPDGTGSLKYAATRTTYDARGNPTKVESGELSAWQADTVAPASWSGFTVLSSVETSYDALGRKLTERVKGSGGTTVSLTQYSYDSLGRLECSAVRMNPAEFASPPSSACTLDTQGSNGPDRITRNVYDVAGQLLKIQQAYGTSLQQDYATYSYSNNGKQTSVTDANGNRAEMTWDGHDRQKRWIFPSATSTGTVNSADYEEYGYDANGNRTSLRKRDGITFAYTYDALNRMTVKDVPTRPLPGATNNLDTTHTRDVYYAYDLFGNQLKARFDNVSTGEGVTNVYDGFGRLTSATLALDSKSWALGYQYDANGNRTRITHPDTSAYFEYSFDGLNRLSLIENASGQDLIEPVYTTRGLLGSVERINGKDQVYSYDAAGRLSGLAIDGGQTSSEVAWTLTRNAAAQVLTDVRDNDSYAYGAHTNVTRPYTVNGLNQYTAVSGASYCSDKNGNLIWDGDYVYVYDAENRMVQKRAENANRCPQANSDYTGTLIATLRYDPLGRLYEVTKPNPGGYTLRLLHDGDALVGEYLASGTPTGTGTLYNRYVHGSDAGADDPLLWFENTTATASSNAKHFYADRLGSIVLVGDSAGSSANMNSYDEWGRPGASNGGRFQYTGQVWLNDLGLYYYKARMYSPLLGRFMQTDPIGYDDQVNLYGYVGNDPVNEVDASGKCPMCVGFVIGAVEDIAVQTIIEGKDFEDIDVGDVLISGAAGATGVGLLRGVSRVATAERRGVRAERALEKAQRSAARAGGERRATRAASQARRAKSEMGRARSAARTAIGATAATAAVKAGGQAASPPVKPKDVKKGAQRAADEARRIKEEQKRPCELLKDTC